MPEEINPTEKPLEIEEETPQAVGKMKEKRWFKPLLFSILGLVLAAGLVFAGYKLGRRQAGPILQPTPIPSVLPSPTGATGYYVAGIDLTINKALRIEKENGKDLLVLTVTFAANTECPLAGGAVCGYDTRGFRLVDEQGFVQDMLFSYPTIKYLTTNPISQRTLKLGEKDRGEVFFEIPKDENRLFLTYSSAGETTEKILIEPELFDPTASWEDYTNTEYAYSIKYPPEMESKEEEPSRVFGPIGLTAHNFIVWGPTQRPETEFYDGLSVTLGIVTNLEEFLLRDFADQISQPTVGERESFEEVQVGDLRGFKAVGVGLGRFTHIFLPYKTADKVVKITAIWGGNKKEEYRDNFDLMLSTFQLLD